MHEDFSCSSGIGLIPRGNVRVGENSVVALMKGLRRKGYSVDIPRVFVSIMQKWAGRRRRKGKEEEERERKKKEAEKRKI